MTTDDQPSVVNEIPAASRAQYPGDVSEEVRDKLKRIREHQKLYADFTAACSLCNSLSGHGEPYERACRIRLDVLRRIEAVRPLTAHEKVVLEHDEQYGEAK